MAEPFNVLTPETIQKEIDASCANALPDAEKVQTTFFSQRRTKMLRVLPDFDPRTATDDEWDRVIARRSGICNMREEIDEEARDAESHLEQVSGK